MEEIEQAIIILKSIRSSLNKISLLHYKMSKMEIGSNSRKKTSVNLDWECMNLDKLKTDFARLYEKSDFKTGIEEKIYNPDGFHEYRH